MKKRERDEDQIGTKFLLNLPQLEPILLGKETGTPLNLDLPTLPPILLFPSKEEKQKGKHLIKSR